MHELPVVERLLAIALGRAAAAGARRIVALDIAVGELCDGQPEWMRRYFSLASRGTPAEGAELRFVRVPAAAECAACGASFAPELRRRAAIRCPECGSDDCALSGGLDYTLERMEVL